jgi:hypothetical protein
MATFSRLPRLPRSNAADAGPLNPRTWNDLVDYVEALEKRVNTFTPQSSSDIAVKYTSNGFTSHLKRRGGAGGTGIKLPFHASRIEDGEDSTISVLGGAYQEGAAGAWVVVPPTAATVGNFAYLVIAQDSARAITSVTVSIEAAALTPVVVSGSGTTSNVPLAEMVTVGDETKLIQRRHGNFTIGLHQIDGDVVRWPDTLVGTIPTPPPPPDP